MAIYIFWPDSQDLTTRGFGRVAHVPCFFDSEWKYQREPSTYLIERALLDWTPTGKGKKGTQRKPARVSLQTYAESLSNFLEWAERRGVDWRSAEYTRHVLEGYQRDMAQGSWSTKGTGLSASTINARVQEACNFMSWAALRGLRTDFFVPTTTQQIPTQSAVNSHGHRAEEVEVRVGRARPDPKTLRLPTVEETKKWMAAVLTKRGKTKALMIELILKTGIRREEAAAWRTDTLPENKESWHVIGDQVEATIRFGTKGEDLGDDNGDKKGPARTIWMPLELAEKLHEYRRGARLAARAKWARLAPNKDEQRKRAKQVSPHLFISDSTGERITAKTLYEAWTGVGHLPFPGWSPHPGRHYWACMTLLRLAKKRADALAAKVEKLPTDWLTSNTLSDIQQVITPQLGHIDKKTTDIYIQWVRRLFSSGETQLQYSDYLDEMEDRAAETRGARD
jgi:integrase